MLSLPVAQPTNPVVGDLRATGSQTFSLLEAALDELPETVLGTPPSWPVEFSAEQFARDNAGSIMWLKPVNQTSGEGRYAVVSPMATQSGAVTLWSTSQTEFSWGDCDVNVIQWLPQIATVQGHESSQAMEGVPSPLGPLRFAVGVEEDEVLLSVSVGDAPASRPRPVLEAMNMRLVAQAMTDKWQAWVPRYGATAPVVVSDVLGLVPRARDAIAILRQSGVLTAAPGGGPDDWAQLTDLEVQAFLGVAVCLVGRQEFLPRLRDAFRRLPGAPAHPSVVNVLTAATESICLIHGHSDSFGSKAEDWVEVYGSSSESYAALLRMLAETLPTVEPAAAGPPPLAGEPLLAAAAAAAGVGALPGARPTGFLTPAAARGVSPLNPAYVANLAGRSSSLAASRTASPALGLRASPLNFAAAASSGGPASASVRVPPMYPPPPLASGRGGGPSPALVVASALPPSPSAVSSAAPVLMGMFAYVGFVGSPEALVLALGGATFVADLRAIALQAGSVRVLLASLPSAVNASNDILAAVSFVDEVFHRTAAVAPWTLDWPAIRSELSTPPLGLAECGDRLVALTNVVSHAVVAARAPPAHTLPTGLSPVELAARRLARTVEMQMVAETSENAAWAASRPLLDVLTSDAAIDATFAADAAIAPSASASQAVRSLVEMPVFGRHAEAAIFSSFKAPSNPGKIDRTPKPLGTRRSALLVAVETSIRGHVGRTRVGVAEMPNVAKLAVKFLLCQLPSTLSLIRMFGGDAPVERTSDGRDDTFLCSIIGADGFTTLQPAAAVDLGTWGKPTDFHSADRALVFVEGLLWTVFHETGVQESLDEHYARPMAGLRPASTVWDPRRDAPLCFGLVKGFRFQYRRGVPLHRIYSMIEYATGQLATQLWERRTLLSAPSGSLAAQLVRMFDINQLQAISFGPNSGAPPPQPVDDATNPFSDAALVSPAAPLGGTAGASGAAAPAAAAPATPRPGSPPPRMGNNGAPLKVGPDGLTEWERKVQAFLMTGSSALSAAAARKRAREMPAKELKKNIDACGAAKKAVKPSPPAAAAAAVVVPPAAAQVPPPGAWPPWPPMQAPYGYLPPLPPTLMPQPGASLPPPVLQPPPQPPAGTPPGTFNNRATNSQPESQKMQLVAAAVAAGKLLTDKQDAVRCFDNYCVADRAATGTPAVSVCGWRACFNTPAGSNCTGTRCKCSAAAFSAVDTAIAARVKAVCTPSLQALFS